jgi:hypothetical protein
MDEMLGEGQGGYDLESEYTEENGMDVELRCDQVIKYECVQARGELSKSDIERLMKASKKFGAFVRTLAALMRWLKRWPGLAKRKRDGSLLILDAWTRTCVFCRYLNAGHTIAYFRILREDTPDDVVQRIQVARASDNDPVSRPWNVVDWASNLGVYVRPIKLPSNVKSFKTAWNSVDYVIKCYERDTEKKLSDRWTVETARSFASYHKVPRDYITETFKKFSQEELDRYVWEALSRDTDLRDIDVLGFVNEDKEPNRFESQLQMETLKILLMEKMKIDNYSSKLTVVKFGKQFRILVEVRSYWPTHAET